MVAGVCAGVAEYFDLDPVIVRLGAVALLFSGIGFVLYPAAWIFVPAADGHAYLDANRPASGDRHRQVAAVGLIVIALCIIAGGWWWLPRHWLFPLGLIGAGAFLLARRDKDDDVTAPPPPPTPPQDAPRAAPGSWQSTPPTSVVPAPPAPAGTTEAPTSAVATAESGDNDSSSAAGGDDDAEGDPAMSDDHDPTDPDASGTAGTAGGTATAVDDAPVGDSTSVFATEAGDAGGGGEPPTGDPFRTQELPFPPVPPDGPDAHHHRHHRTRRGRFVSPLVFGALLIWGGAAWLGGVELPTALAVGLLILGSGFVLGAFVGGSKALIAPALVIGGLLVVASIADIPWDSGIGERHWQPQDVSHLHRSYKLAIGEGTLDLSDLDLAAGQTRHVDAKVGIGHLKVIVPDDVQLDLTGHVGAGDVEILGKEDDGFQVDIDRTVAGADDRGKLDLDLEVGLGDLEVVRAA
jgi:phage shock protein PspC (stress-responsive transcriptional regulator)